MTKFLAVLFALTCALAPVLGAAERIAVVDLEKVFREYYKSRIAEENLRTQGETYRAYLLQLSDQRAKLIDAVRKAKFDAQSYALSQEEREKAEKKASELEAQLNEKNSEIKLYAESSAKSLRELEQKKRVEIMEDIRKCIRRRGAAEGYLYIFDSSGKTMNEQPAILVFPDSCDITKVVIEDLNRTAAKPHLPEPAKQPSSTGTGDKK